MLYHQVVVNGKKVINEDVERYQKAKRGQKNRKMGPKSKVARFLGFFA